MKVNAPLPDAIIDALGLRLGGSPLALSPHVVPVVIWPLEEEAASATLGFNDAETNANAVFAKAIALGAVAAQYGAIQLINPAASGRKVFLDLLHVSTGGTADLVVYGRHDAALTTDGGAWFSAYLGGAAGQAHVRSVNNAAQQITDTHGIIQTLANMNTAIRFDPPYRLDAGRGFVVVGGVVNQVLRATFHGREYLG